MPKINIPLDNPDVTTVLNTPTATPQDVSGSLSAASSAIDSYYGQAAQQADASRNELLRAQILKSEADSNAKLSKIVPELVTKIKDTITNTSNAMAAIDQQVFELDKAKRDKAYTVEGMQKLQVDYLNYKDSIANKPDAPLLANKWLNAQTADLLEKAPSEDAKLDMMSRILPVKLNAMEESYQYRQKVLKEQRVNSLYSALNNTIAASEKSPDNVAAFSKQIDSILLQLGKEGVSKSDLKEIRSNFQDQAYERAVFSHITGGNYEAATNLMVAGDAIDNVSEDTRTKLATEITTGHVNNSIETKRSFEKSSGLAAFYTNQLNPASPSAGRIADTAYYNFKSHFGDLSNVDAEGARKYSDSIVKYVGSYNKVIGDDMVRDMISTPFNTTNPNLAMANVMALDTIINDKSNPASNAGAAFIANTTVQERTQLKWALTMATLVKNGMSPEQALTKIQTNYTNGAIEGTLDNDSNAVGKYFADKPNAAWDKTLNSWTRWGAKPSTNPKFEKEFRDLTSSFYLDTKGTKSDPQDAVKAAADMASAVMAKKYKTTKINGKPEIMEAAPELYFNDEKVVNQYINTAVTNYTTQIGGKVVDAENRIVQVGDQKVRLGIMSVPNLTLNEKDAKTYILTNAESGMPIVGDKGFIGIKIPLQDKHFKSDEDMLKQSYDKAGIVQKSEADLKKQSVKDLKKQGLFTKTKFNDILSSIGLTEEDTNGN
jgi:hypothetical protein